MIISSRGNLIVELSLSPFPLSPASYSLTIYFAPRRAQLPPGAWTGFERVLCLLRFLVFVLFTEGDKGRRLLMDDRASRIGVNCDFIFAHRARDGAYLALLITIAWPFQYHRFIMVEKNFSAIRVIHLIVSLTYVLTQLLKMK